MITDINEILTEWAFRTKSGIPNPKSMAHQILLDGIVKNYGWPEEARVELLNNLMEADKVYKSNWPGGKAPKGAKVKTGPKGGKYYIGNPETGEPAHIAKAAVKQVVKKTDAAKKKVDDAEKAVPETFRVSRKKKMERLISKAEGDIITDEVKEKIPEIINKMMGNKELTKEEQSLIQSHIKFVRTEGGRVDAYLALNEEKTWYPAVSNKINILEDKTAPDVVLDWIDNLDTKYPWAFVGNSSEGVISKKQLVPNKITSKRKIAKITPHKDGSIDFKGRPMKPIKQPNPVILVDAIRKNNPDMSKDDVEKRANIVSLQIERYNSQIEDLKMKGDLEYVDYGPVQTQKDRSKTSKNIISASEKRIKDLLDKADRTNDPSNQKVFATLSKLKKLNSKNLETDENARKEYLETLNQLTVDMGNSVDLKDAAADFAEMKVALEKLSQGYAVYIPASEVFKISDILIINPIDTSELKLGNVKDLSNSLKFLNVALEFVGGESVKYKGGGGGISDDKIKYSVYRNKETRKKLYALTGVADKDYPEAQKGVYDFMYPSRKRSKKDGYPPTADALASRKEISDDTKAWAKQNGIMNEEEIESVDNYAEDRGNVLYEKFIKFGVGKNCGWSDDDHKNYKEALKQYLREMKMMEIINNNDLKYTKFANSDQKVGLKNGKPATAHSEELDGIIKPCYMKFKDDPGFSFSKDTSNNNCITATPTNRNPSEIKGKKTKPYKRKQ